jgi:HPr kinase/phosphorylase
MSIPVSKLLQDDEFDLRLQLLAGRAGLQRDIFDTQVQRPGLALTGAVAFLEPGRIQLLGDNEMTYLSTQSASRTRELFQILLQAQPACVIIAASFPVPPKLLDEAEERSVALLVSSHLTTTLAERLTEFLLEHLGEFCSLHGVLVDVMGVGVLMLGKSGIGKSECALDLVLRGNRLVADDVVELKLRPPATIYGSCTALLRHHMEIRGLGIINIKDLYGVSAVRERKKVELVIELVDLEELEDYDRLGVDERTYDILGVEIPYLVIPVRPGRNTTTVVEVAARNLLLKRQGHHSAREFEEKVNHEISDVNRQKLLREEVE